ncbi:hypothetical protein OG992_18590 [Micromonospora sp. NBC_00362]|uniref:hypothetical protein n=1 Tax=Micromonospora sp. NBC_00362 TaxID=2975975 RepID=UPI00225AA2CA|nr:hypothetical protein [Micromonospora sp. NBC_00362]MCX5119197.1 hypothetical protein [Micromonospora sp. NBC_00362]
MSRIWNTALGPLESRLEPLGAFEVGDCFVGSDLRSVYRVTVDCQTHPHGHVETVDLTAGPGEDPNVLWPFHPNTPMHYVVSGLSE